MEEEATEVAEAGTGTQHDIGEKRMDSIHSNTQVVTSSGETAKTRMDNWSELSTATGEKSHYLGEGSQVNVTEGPVKV